MKFLIVALAAFVLCEARSKRNVPPDLKAKLKELKQDFPQTEWDQFYSKLTTVLGSQKADFEGALEKNKGNMDLTLEQFKDKLTGDYPVINQHWTRVKGKWDTSIGKMDETTIRDLFNFVKTNAEQVLGKPLTENNVKQFVDNMKNYLVTYFNRMSTW